MKKCNLAWAVFAFVAGVALTGCEKESFAEQQIAGRWTLQHAVDYRTLQGNVRHDTTYYSPSDYLRFNTNGTLVIHEGTSHITGQWKMENNKLWISGTNYLDYPNGFEIPVLTGNELQLHYTQQDQTSILEQRLNLFK